MSFPGAFPPISLASFQAAVAKEAGDVSPVLPELFRIYELSHADPQATFFIDGGVLDNKPFGHAIAAIKRRAAESEVERRLLYLEPDPGGGGRRGARGRRAEPDRHRARVDLGPSARGAGARRHPRGQRHNERVLRIREIVETSFEPIRRRIEEIVGTELDRLTREQSPADVVQWRTRINEDAKAAAGLRLRDLPPQQGEWRRRQLRADDLPPLRLPGRLQPGGVRPRRRPLLGGHAPATATRSAGRLRPTTWSRSCGRSTSPTARAGCASSPTASAAWYAHAGEPGYPTRARTGRGQAHAVGRARAARRRDGRPRAAHEHDRRRARRSSPRRRSTPRSRRRRGPDGIRGRTRRRARACSRRSSARRSTRGSPAPPRRSTPGCSGSARAGRPSGAPTCSSATSASRTGTSCSTPSRLLPTPASGTRSTSSG